MEIRVLRYFLTVAREGSITRAANFLHLTQPTLSRQLQDLEKELGQKLFVRGSHNISLTPEGMILRKRAEEIVDMVDKTESVFRSISDTVSGDVYIGGGETESMKYIAEVVKNMQDEYPAIKYHLYSGNAEDVTERLDKGLLDFGILIQPTDLSKYEYITLPSKDVWGVLMKKNSTLASKEEIKLDDLYDFEKMNVVATYNLVYNARIMVEEGIGYALTLDKLVNTMHTSNIAFRPLSPKLESGLDIVWKKYQIFSPAANLFLSKLKEKFL